MTTIPENTMQITAQVNYGELGQINFNQSISSDINIHDLLSVFRHAALSLGYMESTWEDGVLSMADEISHYTRFKKTLR